MLQTADGQTAMKRYVHQPLTIDHHGIRASIKESGKVVIQSAGKPVPGTDEMEYDEVEIPASLVFKLATLLKDTRSEVIVPVTLGTISTVSK